MWRRAASGAFTAPLGRGETAVKRCSAAKSGSLRRTLGLTTAADEEEASRAAPPSLLIRRAKQGLSERTGSGAGRPNADSASSAACAMQQCRLAWNAIAGAWLLLSTDAGTRRGRSRPGGRLVVVQFTSEGCLAQDECSVRRRRRPSADDRLAARGQSASQLRTAYRTLSATGVRPSLDVAGRIAHLLGRRRADQHVQAERRQLTGLSLRIQRGPVAARHFGPVSSHSMFTNLAAACSRRPRNSPGAVLRPGHGMVRLPTGPRPCSVEREESAGGSERAYALPERSADGRRRSWSRAADRRRRRNVVVGQPLAPCPCSMKTLSPMSSSAVSLFAASTNGPVMSIPLYPTPSAARSSGPPTPEPMSSRWSPGLTGSRSARSMVAGSHVRGSGRRQLLTVNESRDFDARSSAETIRP